MAAQVIRALSSLTEVGVGLVAAVVIAMVSSWILALVIMGFIPLLVVAGLVQVWLLGRRGSSRDHTHSSQVSPLPLMLFLPLPRPRHQVPIVWSLSLSILTCFPLLHVCACAGGAGVCDAHEDSAAVWSSGDFLSEAQESPEGTPRVRGHSAALSPAVSHIVFSPSG